MDEFKALTTIKRELERERILGMLTGILIGIFLCTCIFAGFLVWAYQYGNSIS